MELPSVWGRHDQAVIDPVLVEGKALVTSIMDAPAEWHPRLQTLGFKKLTKAWLKVGALTQAEYFYVSPSIDLIGLRPEQVLDFIPGDKPDIDVPPFSLQDEMLDLWQRKPGAVLTTLTMEHGASFTRQEAWRVIEATITGSTIPESETLVGLALASMRGRGSVPDDAQAYAQRLGWESGEASETSREAPIALMRAGDSISWFDSEGVLKKGRLAQKVLTTDTQGLVYTTSPHWVGNYPVVSPEYISRSQFYYPDSTPDWLESDLVAEVAVNPITSADLPGKITITPELHLLLTELMYTGAFPVSDWRAKLNQASLEATESLAQLEAQLDHLKSHYYGSSPFAFKLLSFRDQFKLSLSSVMPGTGATVVSGAPITATYDITNTDESVDLDLSQLAASCDDKLREHAARLRNEAEMVGLDAGVAGGLLLGTTLTEGRRTDLDGLLKTQQGQLDTDGLYRILAASGVRGIAHRVGAYGRGETQRLTGLSLTLAMSGSQRMASVKVERHKDGWYGVSDILASVEKGEGFLKLQRAVISNYAIYVTGSSELIGSDSQFPGVSHVTTSGEIEQFSLTQHVEKLQESYTNLLGRLTPLVDEDSRRRIERALEVASGLHLRERFLAAMAKARDLTSEQIKGFARQALSAGTKGSFLQGSEEWQDRVLDRVVKIVQGSSTNQAILMFSRKRSIAFDEVGFEEESLSQSRQATLMAAAVDAKQASRATGTPIYIDLIDIVDPELTALLAGDQGLVVRSAADQTEGHQDIGVVQGLAVKDIRGMTSETLTNYAEKMSDLQKTKYLKKELIFPRTTLQDMQEQGVQLEVAASWDALWKSLPSKPLSPAPRHTGAFIDLMYIMREHLSPVLEKHLQASERTSGQFARFSDEIYHACIEARERIDRNIYDYRSRRMRGIGADWGGFDPEKDYRWTRILSKMSWDDLVKKRKKPTTSSGSRVQRGEVVRVGDDYRQGKDVDGEDFLKTFMFSGVEYGNWTNQKERGTHLNFAYDSMMDFAKTMGWEPAALSLGGRLGLCIGSRGRGGKRAAVAHFEPTNYAINLTRMRGDGSLAHEFFHAVATHYGQIGSGSISDITDSLAYPLVKAGDVPAVAGGNGLRTEVREAFYNLMVAIMRKPEPGGDDRDIASYRESSDMMKAAINEDGGETGKYWSEPCEMFARSMETWFREHLNEQGKRNDYLVSPNSPLDGVYPNREHLDRINHFVSSWIDALEIEVRSVNHPYLGDVQIPTLNSFLRAQQPFSQQDIEDLAQNQLAELFGACAPELQLTSGKAWAGMYAAASNVIYLNEECADKGTFYHEAWHACESMLLTEVERNKLSELFSPGTKSSERVMQIMRDQGWPEHVINAAASSSQEMTAYAFQLWTAHELHVSDCTSEFKRGRTFIDGVTEVSELFEFEDAIRLFERFAAGELGTRATSSHQLASSVDEEAFIYWSPPEEALTARGHSPGM